MCTFPGDQKFIIFRLCDLVDASAFKIIIDFCYESRNCNSVKSHDFYLHFIINHYNSKKRV